MRCFSCAKFSWSILCDRCKETLFVPTVSTRKIGTLDVISFYHYSTLEPLLLTKHKPEGYRIFKALAKMTMRPFIEEFVEHDEGDICIVGIDERVNSGYSHVAMLTHAMHTPLSRPLHASLIAQNRVNYAGKPLQYRLDNPRDFRYRGRSGVDVILVDDIITTGITLQEAQKVLSMHDVNVLFALTLADAKE
ncbi:MAG: ComF family protein [Sulfurovum sp.]|nr:MAG: ComF family protein [Sulfurovum sp.]